MSRTPEPPEPPEPWNHNIHHGERVLDVVPPRCVRALDVGCGNGLLTTELAGRADHVIGLDLDAPVLATARDRVPENVSLVRGDLLGHPFRDASFDLIASVSALHHMDERAALERMRDLVRPGGVIAVVGIGRDTFPRDLGWQLAGAVTTRWLKRSRTYWEHSAPIVWPPPSTYAQLRTIVDEVLPGAVFTRHVLWRWSAVWTRPA